MISFSAELAPPISGGLDFAFRTIGRMPLSPAPHQPFALPCVGYDATLVREKSGQSYKSSEFDEKEFMVE